MLKRLPISLKIDDEDGDFYYGFIEEKRKNRELTTLILNLLKLYHSNEEVRKIADDFIMGQNPYLKIHEELQRIAFEHKKQTTSTGMISDFTRNEMNKVQQEEVYEKPQEEESKPNMELLMEQMSKLVTESVSKAMSEYQGKESNIEEITNKAMQDVKESMGNNNAPILNKAPLQNSDVVQDTKPKEKQKAVPKSFKKMVSSVQ